MRDLMLTAIALDSLIEHRMRFRKLLNLVPQTLEQDPVGANPLIEGVETPAHGGHALMQLSEALLHVGDGPLHVDQSLLRVGEAKLHLTPHGSQTRTHLSAYLGEALAHLGAHVGEALTHLFTHAARRFVHVACSSTPRTEDARRIPSAALLSRGGERADLAVRAVPARLA
jgi:hypothetical protein